jgi:hypothetical protein
MCMWVGVDFWRKDGMNKKSKKEKKGELERCREFKRENHMERSCTRRANRTTHTEELWNLLRILIDVQEDELMSELVLDGIENRLEVQIYQ